MSHGPPKYSNRMCHGIPIECVTVTQQNVLRRSNRMCGTPVECVPVSQWNESRYLKNESRYMQVYEYAHMSRIVSHGTVWAISRAQESVAV